MKVAGVSAGGRFYTGMIVYGMVYQLEVKSMSSTCSVR